jgi:hypothetical protein
VGRGEERKRKGKWRREGRRLKSEGTPRRQRPPRAILREMLRPRRAAWTGLIVAVQLLVSSAASSSPHRCAMSGAACAMCHPSVDSQSHSGAVLASGGDVMAGRAMRLRGGGEEKAPAPAPAGPRVDTRLVFRAQSCNAEDANVVAGTVQCMHVCMYVSVICMYARFRPMYGCT